MSTSLMPEHTTTRGVQLEADDAHTPEYCPITRLTPRSLHAPSSHEPHTPRHQETEADAPLTPTP